MKNLSKKFSSFFAAFAVVFTMGTATTTTSAEACHWGGCHTHNSCSYLKGKENYFKGLANRYLQGSFMYNHYMNKANHYKNKYTQNGCEPTPAPVETGTVCGYVLGDGKGLDGVHVEITSADGTTRETMTNQLGKWSISTIPAGQVSIRVNEDDVDERVPADRVWEPAQVENSNNITVEANKVNDGGLDSWISIEA